VNPDKELLGLVLVAALLAAGAWLAARIDDRRNQP
jgi:hypothetical protein